MLEKKFYAKNTTSASTKIIENSSRNKKEDDEEEFQNDLNEVFHKAAKRPVSAKP
jgi:hypothetical protein